MSFFRRLSILLAALFMMMGCGSNMDAVPTATTTEPSNAGDLIASTFETPSHLPALTPSPTVTPDLRLEQLDKLYIASLAYLAADEDGSYEVAHALGYSALYGRPHDMCGPLAFKILQDAGLVSRYITLRDYWLLNPSEDMHLLERTFPRRDFEWLTLDQPINRVDYSQFPLHAGDLLYIYSGASGDYSHVLAVTRVDEVGRAYAVTNNYTEDGFVIQEYMLYDPNQPGEGIFYAWSDPANAHLGLTGFGGFDVWRPKSLPYYADKGDPELIAEIDSILTGLGGEWYLHVERSDGQVFYSRRANYRISDPLALRLPIAVLLLKSLEAMELSSPQTYLENNTLSGRTYISLLNAMLVDADISATTQLRDSLSSLGLDVSRTLQVWGLENTYLTVDTTTVEDLIILQRGLFKGEVLQAAGWELLLDFMREPHPQDAFQSAAPNGFEILNLPFFLSGGFPKVGHMVILDKGGNAYWIVLFSFQSLDVPITSQVQMDAVNQIALAICTSMDN